MIINATSKLAAVAILSLLIAAITMRIQRDDARTELATYRAEVATATAQAQAQARATEKNMQTQLERLTHENKKREKKLSDSAAAANSTAQRLRDTINTINAREASTDPGITRILEQANTARNLLGACAERYTSVAAEADRLVNQVNGLQSFARHMSCTEQTVSHQFDTPCPP